MRILFRGYAVDGDVGEVLRDMCVKGVKEDLCTKSGNASRVFFNSTIWQPLASPLAFKRVWVRGKWHDLRESMYATWLGYFGRLDRRLQQHQHPDRAVQAANLDMLTRLCPLCGEHLHKYSTAHAMAWCSDAGMVHKRTAIVTQVDSILAGAGFVWPVREGNLRHTGRETTLAPGPLSARRWGMLHRAGLLLLDGDGHALRGVPLAAVAEWMLKGRHRQTKEQITRSEVIKVYTAMIAVIVVDGQEMLLDYCSRVERLLGIEIAEDAYDQECFI